MKGDSKEDIFADGYIACRAVVLSRGSFINEFGSPHGKQDLSVMAPGHSHSMGGHVMRSRYLCCARRRERRQTEAYSSTSVPAASRPNSF